MSIDRPSQPLAAVINGKTKTQINEHGGTEGLVTLEDLIESIIGMDIVDETDHVEDMRILARKRWIKRAEKMGIKDPSF